MASAGVPDNCPVIPQVASFSPKGDATVCLSPGSNYYLEISGSKEGADVFRAYLAGCELKLAPAARKSSAKLRFQIGGKSISGVSGAYRIEAGKKGIVASAADFTGAFYALQTLIQLAAANPENAIPYCVIEDAPRYAYRGLLFDMVRHFHSKDFILKQLDMMALLKMNVLHLHLTDNEGWRIALDCAPEMTKKAAFGDSLYFHTILSPTPLKFQDEPRGYKSGTLYEEGGVYGGYYSKEDLKEIISYAAARHIEVIPEIEIPGHNKALLYVHPEFFCDGAHRVDNVFCPGNEAAFDFFYKVLDEVMELFPSKFMHIGGDEAAKYNWNLCSRCKERMAAEGLKDVFELQSYCIRRMDKFIVSRGKKLIGWDEILEGGLSENATVMSWRGTQGGLKAIQMNHDVIMTPNTFHYLDYCQDAPWKEPVAFNSCLTLERVYSYEPEAEIPDNRSRLLGVQGNLWSECIMTDSHFEYMLYPRTFAIAETAWSPRGSKDYPQFRSRAIALCGQLGRKGYTCFDLSTEVGERPQAKVEIPRITQNAHAVIYIGNDVQGKEAPSLVDGYLGGWSLRGKTAWMDIRRYAVTVDIDLGEIKDVHYVGAEFVDYKLRRFFAPQDTEFYLSEDGVNYELADIPQLRLYPDRKYFAILTVGGTVQARARYVRLRYNTGSPKYRTFISEVIVN